MATFTNQPPEALLGIVEEKLRAAGKVGASAREICVKIFPSPWDESTVEEIHVVLEELERMGVAERPSGGYIFWLVQPPAAGVWSRLRAWCARWITT